MDCGRVKSKKFDAGGGIQRFQVHWISQANAAQRAGRAGRTCAGHAYRLYSTAVYANRFPEFPEPEILQTPVESVVLLMKCMGVTNVMAFPFPTPPHSDAVTTAMQHLKCLGALSESDYVATDVGRVLVQYPVLPRFAKMLYMASKSDESAIVSYMCNTVAVMSTMIDVFQRDWRSEADEEEERKIQVSCSNVEDAFWF